MDLAQETTKNIMNQRSLLKQYQNEIDFKFSMFEQAFNMINVASFAPNIDMDDYDDEEEKQSEEDSKMK